MLFDLVENKAEDVSACALYLPKRFGDQITGSAAGARDECDAVDKGRQNC